MGCRAGSGSVEPQCPTAMTKALQPDAGSEPRENSAASGAEAGGVSERSGPAEAISGYELARRVLGHEKGGVAALLALAGGRETDWLEFKAAMVGRGKGRKQGEKDADGHWNVAEAVIAMANTCGGAVIIGIEDKTKRMVGLQSGDPRRIIEKDGLEDFLRREIKERIEVSEWDTGREGRWKLDGDWPTDLFEVRAARERQEGTEFDLAVILVKPIPEGAECLICYKNGEERLPKRAIGHVGQVEALKGSKRINAWQADRVAEKSEYAQRYRKFLLDVEREGHADRPLEVRIAACLEKQRDSLRKKLASFVTLDAEERVDLDIGEEGDQPDAEEFYGEEWDPSSAISGGIPSFRKQARGGGAFDLLKEARRAVLLGDPGAGKTWCLKRFALEMADDYQPCGSLAIYVPLSALQDADTSSESPLLPLMVRGAKFGNPTLTEDDIKNLIATDRLVLLLDALDECPNGLRNSGEEAIRRLLRTHPLLRCVVSARTVGWSHSVGLKAFALRAMDERKREEYLRKRLKRPGDVETLKGQLEDLAARGATVGTPLFLMLAGLVFEKDRRLPRSHALLVRRCIELWWDRELKRAKRKAEDVVEIETEKVLLCLSKLAFAIRSGGGRSISKGEAVEEITGLVALPEFFLESAGSGFVLRREEGGFEFAHKVFEEVLCGEALRRGEAIPPAASRGEGASPWAAPVVFAWQLSGPSRDLALAAWSADPWLGATLDPSGRSPWERPKTSGKAGEEQRGQDDSDPTEGWSPAERAALAAFRGGTSGDLGIGQFRGWLSRREGLAPLLRQVAANDEGAAERWKQFEAGLLSACLNKVGGARQLRYSLLLLEGAVSQPAEIMRTARERMGPEFAWTGEVPEAWIADVEPVDAARMVLLGLCQPETFAARCDGWVAAANPEVAAALVAAGIIARERCSDRTRTWAAQATPQEAAVWVRKGICDAADFEDRRKAWVEGAVPSEAIALVDARICRREEFDERKRVWLNEATVEEAWALVGASLATREEFGFRRDDWIAQAGRDKALSWVEGGLFGFRAEEFEERRSDWIQAAPASQAAAWMIEARQDAFGLLAEDFAGRKDEWKSGTTIEDAVALTRAGIMGPEEWEDRLEAWKDDATIRQAVALVEERITDFSLWEDRKDEWLEKSSIKDAIASVEASAALADRAEKANDQEASAPWLSAWDFEARFDEWEGKATPEEAVALEEADDFPFSHEDFEARFEEWRQTATEEQIDMLENAGFPIWE